MKAKNAKEQRRENANLVLRIIQAQGPVSRQEIANKAGLSIPSVTNIVSYLEELSLVKSESSFGRNGKPVPVYEFDGSTLAALGMEFNRRNIHAVAVDFSGNIVDHFTIDHGSDDYKTVVEQASGRLLALRARVQADGIETIGLGIAAPGPIDEDGRTLSNPYGFHGWVSMPLVDDFERLTGLPTILQKDTDLSALAEHLRGAGAESDSMIYAKFGEGIGSAVIDKGKLFGERRRLHSSLGHTTLIPRGEQCECGNHGCLEVYTRLSRVEEELRRCNSQVERDEVLERVAEYIAIGLANQVVLFGIQHVVVDGDGLDVDATLMDRISRKLPQHAVPKMLHDVCACRGTVGAGSAAVGAALQVMERSLSMPESLRASVRRAS